VCSECCQATCNRHHSNDSRMMHTLVARKYKMAQGHCLLFPLHHPFMIILNSKYKLFLLPLISCIPIKILKYLCLKITVTTTHPTLSTPPTKVAVFRIQTMHNYEAKIVSVMQATLTQRHTSDLLYYTNICSHYTMQ